LIFNFSITLCKDRKRYFPECCVGVVCFDGKVLLVQCQSSQRRGLIAILVRVIVQKKKDKYFGLLI